MVSGSIGFFDCLADGRIIHLEPCLSPLAMRSSRLLVLELLSGGPLDMSLHGATAESQTLKEISVEFGDKRHSLEIIYGEATQYSAEFRGYGACHRDFMQPLVCFWTRAHWQHASCPDLPGSSEWDNPFWDPTLRICRKRFSSARRPCHQGKALCS